MTDPWPEKLSPHSETRESSLSELRQILLLGLKAGLSGRASTDEAFLEDITQMSLLKIVEKLDTFQHRGKFTSWALAIGFRVAYNELRKKEWQTVSLEALLEKQASLPEEVDSSTDSREKAERRSDAALLRETIEQELTTRQRDVLMCILNGMHQEEIARLLNTNRNNVYKLFHDGRKALKKNLEARGHDKNFFFGYSSQPASPKVSQ